MKWFLPLIALLLVLSGLFNVWQYAERVSWKNERLLLQLGHDAAQANAKYGTPYQVAQVGGMPAAFDTRSADFYALTTAGVVRINFITGQRDVVPLKTVAVEDWRTNAAIDLVGRFFPDP